MFCVFSRRLGGYLACSKTFFEILCSYSLIKSLIRLRVVHDRFVRSFSDYSIEMHRSVPYQTISRIKPILMVWIQNVWKIWYRVSDHLYSVSIGYYRYFDILVHFYINECITNYKEMNVMTYDFKLFDYCIPKPTSKQWIFLKQ